MRTLALCAVVALAATTARGVEVTNPISQFPITVDGQFTDGVGTGEWSDTTPLAFISPPTGDGFSLAGLKQAQIGDPGVNSLLYAALAPGDGAASVELYLMYVYLPRTNPDFFPGEFVADIVFPITITEELSAALANNFEIIVPSGDNQLIAVQVRGGFQPALTTVIGPSPGLFDVSVAFLNNSEANTVPADLLGMEAAVGFGPSPLSSDPHMLIELEVPLHIDLAFLEQNPDFRDDRGGFVPGTGGINPATGLYDPDPAFWGGFFANDTIDPPGSAAIFTINPNGSVTSNSNFLPTAAVPEPSSMLAFGGLALGFLAARRRRK